jgi:hypothetical protein
VVGDVVSVLSGTRSRPISTKGISRSFRDLRARRGYTNPVRRSGVIVVWG